MQRTRILSWVTLASLVPVMGHGALHFLETGYGDVALVFGAAAIGAFLLRKPVWSGLAALAGMFATINAATILLHGGGPDGWAIGFGYLAASLLLMIGGAALARPLRRPQNHPPQ